MGGNVPTPKKCFKNEGHALEVFKKELNQNLQELQEHGLLFSFTTDSLLEKTISLTMQAVCASVINNIPVKLLTKRADFDNGFVYPPDRPQDAEFAPMSEILRPYRNLVAFGFTLTGHDEMEPHASTNAERIEAMRKLHNAGFKTFASIEPVIDIRSSFEMIFNTAGFCDLYKIGLMSGKQYTKHEILWLIGKCHEFTNVYKEYNFPIKFYFKDNILKAAGIQREELTENCVTRDYNIFK
jgi:hypothetical protein